MNQYFAYNLAIQSVFLLPELMEHVFLAPDVTIQRGSVSPKGLQSYTQGTMFYQMNQHQCWINVPSVARFLVEDGQSITVEPVVGIDDESIVAFILEPCLGLILMQRDLVVLQGNAIANDEKSIVFLGAHSMGKSTLSAAFFKRGYTILSDGIVVINQHMEVIPSFPALHLWQDAATHLNINTSTFRRVRPKFEKFIMPTKKQFNSQPKSIQTIYPIHWNKGSRCKVEPLLGGDKLRYLHAHIYNKSFLTAAKKQGYYFNCMVQIAKQVKLILIERTRSHYNTSELVELIAKTAGL
jgi:hypothetical protein